MKTATTLNFNCAILESSKENQAKKGLKKCWVDDWDYGSDNGGMLINQVTLPRDKHLEQGNTRCKAPDISSTKKVSRLLRIPQHTPSMTRHTGAPITVARWGDKQGED